MRRALILVLFLALTACGEIRNGGGLMGNRQIKDGCFTVYRPNEKPETQCVNRR